MLTPEFPPEKLAKYPHMAPEDLDIWERFLEKYAQHFFGFSYDVKVGTPVETSPDWPENIKAMAETLTKKRIDAVGYTAANIWIFEVKPRAGASAIGQVNSYVPLFVNEFRPERTVLGAIVTDNEERDMVNLCNFHNIRLIVV